MERWHATERTGRRGAPKRDSDWAVPWGWVMREVFHWPLRALEGLPRLLLALWRVTLNTPDDSTFSPTGGGTDGVDRTPRVFATPVRGDRRHRLEGLRRRRMDGAQPGASRRRTWRKRHLAVDADSHEVAAAAWTAAFVGDAEVLPDLRAQRPAEASIATVTAAADDTQACHPALLERRAAALIPPRAGRWRGRHGPKVHRIHARPLWMPFNHTDASAGNRSVAITGAA